MVVDRIRGVMVPILTPITPDEDTDTASVRKLVDYMIKGGVHGIWAAGTTGEFSALTDKQRLIAIETVVDSAAGRVPVVGNISAPGSKIAVSMGLALKKSGIDGVAATPPYYNPCSQDELLAHYRYIKEKVGLPLWVYNFPGMVKTVVEAPTVAQLAAEGTVVGIKDSSGAGEWLAELNYLLAQNGAKLYRFLGSNYRIGTAKNVGGHGVIPGLGNVAPKIISGLWEAGEAGDTVKAQEYAEKMVMGSRLTRLAKAGSQNGSSMSGMKSALKIMGIIQYDNVTKPLRPLTEEEKKPIPGILKELGLL